MRHRERATGVDGPDEYHGALLLREAGRRVQSASWRDHIGRNTSCGGFIEFSDGAPIHVTRVVDQCIELATVIEGSLTQLLAISCLSNVGRRTGVTQIRGRRLNLILPPTADRPLRRAQW